MGTLPSWYLCKMVADWYRVPVNEAWTMPYRDWLRAFAAMEAETLAKSERESMEAARNRRYQAMSGGM